MAAMWQWARANGKMAGIGLGTGSVAAAYAWNSTEARRMARNIKRGLHGPTPPNEFAEQFCVFGMDEISRGLRSNGMVALIGLKSTGKTTTLKHAINKSPNPFFLKVSDDDVHSAIYGELKDKVWCLPWLADGLRVDARKSDEERVVEVFRLVEQETGKPVLLGFDVNYESKAKPFADGTIASRVSEGVGTPAVQRPISFSPVNFIKRVKYLVEDEKVAKAIISSSEGLLFMSVNEDRLKKILGHELPLATAKSYLQNNLKAGDFEDAMLYQFPRTFAKLKEFAVTSDKAEFCQVAMEEETKKIYDSAKHCKDAKALYRAAAQQGSIDIRIVDAQSNMGTEAHFIAHFVKPNVFAPSPGGKYRLQFDCTERAARAAFGF